ncbi:HEAT repeat domain-containing protein [Actinoplanes sp. KI2]|uniref:HEAT repeat domain-containing protein n=1 Tax=Actinoplanes sp. KI2 TaxID=2983315 RepID=UPI0021D5C268|nr:HEAT repeat domain-containing protein [Actinoplanes sp. KI2]MCU7727435.1 HEAT repeat domain-containing protein [Actinoplanes sp. KI2]
MGRVELPVEVLLGLALREVEDDDPETPLPSLGALHNRPVRQVFDSAAALVRDRDPVRRELGVRILRELGPEQQPDGHRPFRGETVPLLRSALRSEPEPGVLRWIVSALGYHQAREALPEVLALAGHPDWRVRFHVAAALPALLEPADVPPDAADALLRLCRDEDADTRYYALYAVTREVPALDTEAMTRLTAQLATDPDEQIRAMATAHQAAIRQARRLLNDWDFRGVADPGKDPGEYDSMIGSLLTALAQEAEAEDLRCMLDDEIRDRFGMSPDHADTSGMARRLHAWWREHHAD